ncbi:MULTISPECIES: hypothetical protein [unclassified Mesorhizobium]|uniref:hypothetical protein n=1 Tax=unclassified Mesorhizobium TaxID=325217 RepID=UPI00333549CC
MGTKKEEKQNFRVLFRYAALVDPAQGSLNNQGLLRLDLGDDLALAASFLEIIESD